MEQNGFIIKNDLIYMRVNKKIYDEEQIIKIINNYNQHLEYKKPCIERYRATQEAKDKQLGYSHEYYLRNRDEILEKARDKYRENKNI